MTTPDPILDSVPGRDAATLRPVPGLFSLLSQGLFCLGLLALAAPAFAADTGDMAGRLHGDVPISQTMASPTTATAAAPERMPFTADVGKLMEARVKNAAPPAPTAASSRMQTVLQRALALLGTPYRWGGTSTDGFDCSGMVGYVFRSALGIELPRVSRDMATSGEKIDRNALVAGDLVFFSRRGRRVDHVGIYLGNGQFVHAPRTGKDVMVSSLSDGYWSRKFMQARRVAGI